MTKEEQEWTFERSFSRLEQILDKMNSGNVSLDDSLKLYEEADKLIAACAGKLNAAESRIEMLIKKRSGELSLGEEGSPLKEPLQLLEAGSERE